MASQDSCDTSVIVRKRSGFSEAIRDSCNFFFYEMGFRLSSDNGIYNENKGISSLQKYAAFIILRNGKILLQAIKVRRINGICKAVGIISWICYTSARKFINT